MVELEALIKNYRNKNGLLKCTNQVFAQAINLNFRFMPFCVVQVVLFLSKRSHIECLRTEMNSKACIGTSGLFNGASLKQEIE